MCVRRATGDVPGAVEELNGILRLFPAEAASWLELGETYLSICAYEVSRFELLLFDCEWLVGDLCTSSQDAAHCFEELVLLEPRNAAHHAHLAEAYYSCGERTDHELLSTLLSTSVVAAGGADNLLCARKHFSISLSHQGAPFNLRAVYGLIASCKAIESAEEQTKMFIHVTC